MSHLAQSLSVCKDWLIRPYLVIWVCGRLIGLFVLSLVSQSFYLYPFPLCNFMPLSSEWVCVCVCVCDGLQLLCLLFLQCGNQTLIRTDCLARSELGNYMLYHQSMLLWKFCFFTQKENLPFCNISSPRKLIAQRDVDNKASITSECWCSLCASAPVCVQMCMCVSMLVFIFTLIGASPGNGPNSLRSTKGKRSCWWERRGLWGSDIFWQLCHIISSSMAW